jgi:hypothetical protein
MPSGVYDRKPRETKLVRFIECSGCLKRVKATFLKQMPKIYKKNTKGNNPIVYMRSVYVDPKGRQFNGKECPDCKYGIYNQNGI